MMDPIAEAREILEGFSEIKSEPPLSIDERLERASGDLRAVEHGLRHVIEHGAVPSGICGTDAVKARDLARATRDLLESVKEHYPRNVVEGARSRTVDTDDGSDRI